MRIFFFLIIYSCLGHHVNKICSKLCSLPFLCDFYKIHIQQVLLSSKQWDIQLTCEGWGHSSEKRGHRMEKRSNAGTKEAKNANSEGGCESKICFHACYSIHYTTGTYLANHPLRHWPWQHHRDNLCVRKDCSSTMSPKCLAPKYIFKKASISSTSYFSWKPAFSFGCKGDILSMTFRIFFIWCSRLFDIACKCHCTTIPFCGCSHVREHWVYSETFST